MANTIQITITADNKASKAIRDTGSALGGLGKVAGGAAGILGGFASALGGVATVAGGIIAANVFEKIVSGLGAFVSTGLDAVGNAQQLEISLKALLTQNNMYEQSVQTVTSAVTEQVMTTEELAIKQGELQAKLATQNATYQENSQKIIQMTAAWGENGLNVIKARAQHEQLALSIQKTERELAGLTTTETSYATSTKIATNQVMSQKEAMSKATAQTAELMKFVSQVAVISPFETEDVELTTKYAVAAGLGVDQTKQFVPAFLDLAAAVGITSSELGFAADQLFQVKKVGKLTEIDLRQLRRLGIDLGKVLAVEMGMSIEEFNAEAEKSPEIFDELFSAITRFSENTFAGTSQEMATSVKGLKSTLSDIFVIGARNFWEPMVDAVTPMAADILSKLSSFVLGGDMASLGQSLADTLLSGLSQAKALINIANVLGFDAAVAVFKQMVINAWPGIYETLFTWGLSFWNFITDTVIPTAAAIFFGLVNYIGQLIVTYWPVIQTQLFVWRDNFFGWVLELYPQIPAMLTTLVENISTFLADNWPTIQEKLAEWSTKFWEWVQTAASQAGAVMAGILVAIGAWATGEGGASLLELGNQLGVMLVDGLALVAQNTDQLGAVMTQIVSGLAIGAAAVTGLLIAIGGQIVAGILAGILEKIGIDIAPATIQEMKGVLTGIGNNFLTIAVWVGEQIVAGFEEGIFAGINNISKVVLDYVTVFVDAWKNELGIASPSTIFANFGVDTIQGFIDGLMSVDLVGALSGVFSGVMETISGLFSGGGEEGGGGMLFDPTAMITGLTTVNTWLTETLPASVSLLQANFLLFSTVTTEQLNTLIAGPLTMFIITLSSIYLVHLIMLQATWISSTAIIITQITLTITNINLLIGVINQATAAATTLSNTFVAGMNAAASGITRAADKIKSKLIPAMEQARSVANSLAAALRSAAAAAKGLGGGLSEAGIAGEKQHGGPVQSGLTYLVGEAGPELFTPSRSGNIIPNDQLRSGSVVNNYFNQVVNTSASSSTVISDFRTMQLLLGT